MGVARYSRNYTGCISHTLWSVYSSCILPISITKRNSIRFTLYYPIVIVPVYKCTSTLVYHTISIPVCIKINKPVNLLTSIPVCSVPASDSELASGGMESEVVSSCAVQGVQAVPGGMDGLHCTVLHCTVLYCTLYCTLYTALHSV